MKEFRPWCSRGRAEARAEVRWLPRSQQQQQHGGSLAPPRPPPNITQHDSVSGAPHLASPQTASTPRVFEQCVKSKQAEEVEEGEEVKEDDDEIKWKERKKKKGKKEEKEKRR